MSEGTEALVMEMIHFCERKKILNRECSLSTIESWRRQAPAKVREHLRKLRQWYGA